MFTTAAMSVSNVLTEPEGIADMLVTVGTGVGGFAVLAVAFEAPFVALAVGALRIGYLRWWYTDGRSASCCSERSGGHVGNYGPLSVRGFLARSTPAISKTSE